ncbi:M20 family metallopeptidase [Leucobacter albus]|uniref:Peptidase M20 domain-containing protein 2 n=1 Tax=Leucobacter albus TaxID=272210 RepID=A0ABW3TS01_9MICO
MNALTAGEAKAAAAARVAELREELLAVSHSIAATPELGMHETHASALLAATTERVSGIPVTRGVGGLPTAFLAEAGTGSLSITICAEYDALPVVGHGCGHNIIATAALGAFLALAPLVDAFDLTVRLLGTPAEENGGGKVKLLDAGAFDGTHAAIMVHPAPVDVLSMNPYASNGIRVRFVGKEAHASLSPEQGVNALDAFTIAATAVGLARQQLRPGQQIHYAISEPGGAANVIPGSATAVWMVRGETVEKLEHVTAIVERCVRAGALATGCEVEITRKTTGFYTNILLDHELLEHYHANANALGREPLAVAGPGGSTDMGNVSQVVPAIHPMIGLNRPELTLHTSDFARAAAGPEGDAAALDGAVLLAQTALDFATTAATRERLLSTHPLAQS